MFAVFIEVSSFGGLGVACWPLVPKFAGWIFKGEKNPHRFAACKKSLNGVEVVILAKLPDNILAHKFHWAAGISRIVVEVEAPGGKSGNV
jgi:hypothetical protein